MYTFSKLYDTAQKYGGKTKFGAKNEESTKSVSSTTWQFLGLTAKLSDKRIKALY